MPPTNAELQPASVDEAPKDVLDPADLPSKGATVRIKPYEPMKYRDKVTLFFYDEEIDYIPIGQTAIGKDVTFTVTAQTLIENARENVVLIRYEVQFEGTGTPQKSNDLTLRLSAGFEAGATLDLSGRNYLVAVEKLPVQVPDHARLTRTANWGMAPHSFHSSEPEIASIDERSGEVTARRNGQCVISATDSSPSPQTQRYPLTVKGIHELHFLSHGANWNGMGAACTAAGLEPVSLTQIKQFWKLYTLGLSESVGHYLGWLPYPVWTGTALGAGTVWIYDLEGDSENENTSSSDTDEHTNHQVLGVSRS
ncbi:Ig-like domain-containing protein [Pseudomonas sp. CLCA07]